MASGELTDERRKELEDGWGKRDTRSWLVHGLIDAAFILFADASFLNALLWIAVTCAMAYSIMPAVCRWGSRLYRKYPYFYLAVVIGWATRAGAPIGGRVGAHVGAVLPWLLNVNISSLQGAMIGMVVMPVIAALEGIVVASIVIGAFLLYRRLRGEAGPAAPP